MSWQDDKGRSDRYTSHIIQLLSASVAPLVIGESPVVEDQDRNTDLLVLRMRDVRIACRVRDVSYLPEYRDEFTMRSRRPSGAKTELRKVLSGWGDYIFYGFGSLDGPLEMPRYGIGDLSVFRIWFHEYTVRNRGRCPGVERMNRDGSSAFRAFKWRDLPPEFVIDEYAGGAESQVMMSTEQSK